eukprot:3433363-Prymnesium_polylepis.1
MRSSASTPAIGSRPGARGLPAATQQQQKRQSKPRSLMPLTGQSIVAGMNEMTKNIKVGAASYGDAMGAPYGQMLMQPQPRPKL